jgi:hypothetical protein
MARLADRATASFEKLFWLEDKGLVCRRADGQTRRQSRRDATARRRAAQQLVFSPSASAW